MAKSQRARKDGWSDGFAGAEDDTFCQYVTADNRQAYAQGRAEGYAARLRAITQEDTNG